MIVIRHVSQTGNYNKKSRLYLKLKVDWIGLLPLMSCGCWEYVLDYFGLHSCAVCDFFSQK